MSSKVTVILIIYFISYISPGSAEKVCNEDRNKGDSTSAKQKWIFNPKTSMMMIYVQSTATVSVWDSQNKLMGLYDGKSGTAFLYNNIKEAVYIAPGSRKNTWYESETTFENFFPNMKSQLAMWQIGETEGLVFDAVSIDDNISKELGQILINLSKDFSNPSNAYAIYLQFTTTLAASLNGGLQGLSTATGQVDVEYPGDLLRLNGVFRGMGDFFVLFKGGLETLTKKHVNIDLNTVLQMSSGSHVWMYFIKEISKKIHSDELAKRYNNFYNFFDMINKLGGDLAYGSSGFFNIISKIIGQVDGRTSISTIQRFLKTYFESEGTDISEVKKQFKSDINHLINNLNNLRKPNQFKDLKTALNSMLTNSWTYNNIKISDIITILTNKNSKKNVGQSINKIVKILNKKQ